LWVELLKNRFFFLVRYENSVQVDGTGLSIRDFQEFAGELSFPPGFIPELVSLKSTQTMQTPSRARIPMEAG